MSGLSLFLTLAAGKDTRMPHAPHAAQAHSRVLLDQQLVPDLHYQAVKVLALKGQGQVGRAPGGGGTGKASPGFPLLTVGPGAEKLQLSVPATHVTPPNTAPGAPRALPALQPGTGPGSVSPGRAAPAPETHVVRREPRASPWPPGRRSC